MLAQVVPEAAEGGPIAAIKTGDTISIDVKKRRLDLELPVAEIKKRLKTWRVPGPCACLAPCVIMLSRIR